MNHIRLVLSALLLPWCAACTGVASEAQEQEPADNTGDPSSSNSGVSNSAQNVGSAGGEIQLSSGAQLTIPPGALDDSVALELGEVSSAGLPDLLAGAYLGSPVIVTPHGQAFGTPAQLVLPLPAGRTLDRNNLYVVTLDDESDPSWALVDNWTSSENAVTVELSHLSIYALVYVDEGTDTQEPDPRHMALDEANHRLIVSDAGLNGLYAYDLQVQERSLLSGAGRGTGPQLSFGLPFVLEGNGSKAYYLADGVFEIDLATGNRGRLAVELERIPYAVSLDAEGKRLFVGGLDEASLVGGSCSGHDCFGYISSLDLATLELSTIKSLSLGTGAPLYDVIALTYDSQRETLFALNGSAEGGSARVVAVDPASGETRLVADQVGEGGWHARPTSLAMGSPGGALYAAFVSLGAQIARISPESESASIISDGDVHSGPILSSEALAVNRENTIAYTAGQGGERMGSVINSSEGLFQVDLTTGQRTRLSY